MSGEMAENGRPAPGFYPVTVPRDYWGLGLPLMILAMTGFGLLPILSRPRAGPALFLGALALAAGAWLAFLVTRRHVILSDAVETRSLLGVRRMSRSDIIGCRNVAGGRFSSPARILFTREGGRTLRIPNAKTPYVTWIDGLPDLDVAARQAGQAALEANPALGATVSTRTARIQAVRYASGGLQILAGLSCAYLIWRGAPGALAWASAVAPLIAIAITFALTRVRHESLGGQQHRIDTRWLIVPSVCLAYAGMGLGVRLAQLQLLSKWSVVEAGLLLALPVAAAALWLDRNYLRAKPAWMPLFIVAGAVGWAAGTLAEVNLLADHAPGTVYVTRIAEKQIEHHSRSADTYRVILVPWKGMDGSVATEVSSDLYDSLRQGEPMCVTQHPGALGFAWFEDRPCPGAQPSAPPNRAVHSAS